MLSEAEIAQACAGSGIVLQLYAMVEDWRKKQRPGESEYAWDPTVEMNGFRGFSQLIWGTARAWRRRPGPRRRYHWVEEHAPVALCAKDQNGTVFCSFRGTSISKDWDMNAQFTAPRVPGSNTGSDARAHSGFMRMFTSMEAAFVRELNGLLSSGTTRRVVFTGHSLGGALSLLAAHQAGDSSNSLYEALRTLPCKAYVFGCPRVGNDAFCEELENRLSALYRFENTRDPVPNLPPERLGPIQFRFRHPGKAILLNEDTGSRIRNHSMKTYDSALQGERSCKRSDQ